MLNNKGDTIRGFVDYREWNKNPRSFNFKKQIDLKSGTQYSTADCAGFSVTGYEIFERYTLKISNDATNLSALEETVDTTTISGNFFLRGIIKGKNVSLYSYNDSKKLRYFIKKGNELPEELIYHKYIQVDDSRHEVTDERYKFQLQQIAAATNQSSDESFSHSVGSSSYDERDLTTIVERINGEKSSFKYSADAKSRFFVGVGFNMVHTAVDGTNSLSGASSTSFSPGLTFGNDFYMNKNTGALIIRTELNFLYRPIKLSKNVTSTGFTIPSTYNQTYKYDQVAVAFSPKLLYNFFNKPDFKVYMAAGLSVAYFSTYNQSDKITDDQHREIVTETYSMKSFAFNILTQAGVTIKNRVNIFAGYTLPMSSTDNYLYFEFKTTVYQAGINFIFGK